MASRRRSRIKSIAGNINDVQKRLRYLETRPAPAQLARKVVQTGNIALRAIQPDVVADAAIVRRTLAPEAVISANLAVVGDPDDAAVARENIQISAVDTDQINDSAVTNVKLAGEIEDGKLIGISASKVGPDLLVDDQIETLSASKVGPDLLVDDQLESISASKVGPDLLVDDQLESISASKIGPDLIADDQIDSISASKIGPDLIVDDQIDGISGEKIIGGIDGNLIVEETVSGAGQYGGVSKIVPNSIGENDISTDACGFDELQVDSVGTAQLQENSVVAVIIDSLAIERRHLNDDVIIARMINAGAVQTEKIQNLAVTNAKIDNFTITGGKIAESTITANKIFGGTNIVTTISGGTGITVNSSAGTYGRVVTISSSTTSLTLGSGSTQAAAGNHVHGSGGYSSVGGGGVPSHTHSFADETSNATGHTHQVSGTTGTPSTLKLKKEITDYSMADVKNLLNLNLKRYKYKNQARNLQEGREWMYGYIAEEVEELGIKEIVGYDKNKEPNAINYGLLSTLVLELVKVQQTEIDSLKEEIQRLKEKI
jgi:hypothetical protein